MPIDCNTIASKSGRHLFARRDDSVVLTRVMQHRGFTDPGDQLVGDAGHGRDDDCDFVAGVDFAFDVVRHIADTLHIGDRSSAEFHDDDCHITPLLNLHAARSGGGMGHSSLVIATTKRAARSQGYSCHGTPGTWAHGPLYPVVPPFATVVIVCLLLSRACMPIFCPAQVACSVRVRNPLNWSYGIVETSE